MKIAILTTPTKHHTFFINKLSEYFDVCTLVYETNKFTAPFLTGPFFEEEEDEFEERFFSAAHGGTQSDLPNHLTKILTAAPRVNGLEIANRLKRDQPDVIVLFGVGLVDKDIFSLAKWGAINVHRGFTQTYRGLDSDLWSIFNNDFDQIGVTLHYVDESLDTGDILAQQTIPIVPGDKIYHLRYKTTLCATDMMIDVLNNFEQRGSAVPGKALYLKGRYYSAMPLKKKYEALKNFESYCKNQSE